MASAELPAVCKGAHPAAAQQLDHDRGRGAEQSGQARKAGRRGGAAERRKGWVSEVEGISEKKAAMQEGRLSRSSAGAKSIRNVRRVRGLNDHHASRITRSSRSTAAFGVNMRRSPDVSRSSPEKESCSSFPLANLEAYLKDRGPSALVKESLGFSPSSRRPPLHQYPNQSHRVDSACPSNLSESSAMRPARLLATRYGSANEAAGDAFDDSDDFHSERSGCGMPRWHWPNNHGSQRMRDDMGSIKAHGRRNSRSYKYSSERSVSSFDSDTDMTIPLMTEPETSHHDNYSDIDVHHIPAAPRRRSTSRFKGDVSATQGTSISTPSKHRSLTQKYRPKSFKDLIGQNMVAESLSNAILRAKIAPVYLFYGPRGTGKTTAAKIFTNAMNCLSIEELRPCGLCKECMAFNAGQNYDVKQVDAAGNSDVESVKLLLQHVSLPPSTSRYKVFIVDECHSLTAEAWNALLKCLEEPPSYVVFILITTVDLDQLPRTAISRCQKFMFPRVKDADIVLRLRKLALLEKVEIEVEALQFIASRSDGSFRDAENMLDQLSLLGKQVTLATVQETVGLIPDEKLVKLLELALSGNTSSTVNAIREVMESGVEPLALTSQLAALITDILGGKDRVGRAHLRVKKEEQERLKQVLMVLSEAEKQLRFCSERTTWLTAAFLQFAAPNEPRPASSSRGTSCEISRETLDGDEKQLGLHSHSHSRKDHAAGSAPSKQLINDGGLQKQTYFSAPFGDNIKIHPFDLSSQSSTPIQLAGHASPGVGDIAQYRDKSSCMSPSTMDGIWRKVVEAIHSNNLKQLLQGKGRLVSLSVTEAFAVAYVEFGHPDHKSMAERARLNIAHAFQLALGCPVEVEISLVPAHGSCIQHQYVGLNMDNNNNNSSSNSEKPNSENHRKHANQGVITLPQERRRSKGSAGSFRKAAFNSFTRIDNSSSSPLHAATLHQRTKSRQSFEMSESTDGVLSHDISKSSTISCHNTLDSHQVYRLQSSSEHVQGFWKAVPLDADNGQVQQEKSGDTSAVGGNGTDNYDSESFSDLERLSDRDREAPGALCWKGVKSSEVKQRRRRRKGRFLLRLVPCAKGGGGGRRRN